MRKINKEKRLRRNRKSTKLMSIDSHDKKKIKMHLTETHRGLTHTLDCHREKNSNI